MGEIYYEDEDGRIYLNCKPKNRASTIITKKDYDIKLANLIASSPPTVKTDDEKIRERARLEGWLN